LPETQSVFVRLAADPPARRRADDILASARKLTYRLGGVTVSEALRALAEIAQQSEANAAQREQWEAAKARLRWALEADQSGAIPGIK
jgi:hypothetical protein